MALLVVTLCLATCLLSVTAIDIFPPTLSDSYGNYADQDSNVAFAAVPDGDPYIVDPTAYTYDGLLPLFKGVQGFVNACFFGEDPYETFIGILSGVIAFDGALIGELAKWGGGFALCVVLGIGFIFIFPIVGCCFCCCRTCCNNCGGKMVQKRNGNTSAWRCCYFITLFISCTFLGCGMICTYVVNERMTTLFTDVTTTVNDNVDDFSRYTNNTINQINYVAHDGFNFTAKVMLRDLDNIGSLVGGSVQTAFDQKAGIGEAFDELLKMDPLLLELINGLKAVDTTKNNVVTSVLTLETSMTSVATDIDNTFTTCGTCGNPPDLSGLRSGSNFDPNGMPSFDAELAELESVYAENITALVLDGEAQFNNISKIVEQESAPVIATIRSTVDTFDGVISDALGSVNDMFKLFDAVSNLTDSISGLEKTAIAGSLTLGDIENYRWMGGIGLTCFVLLILLLQLIGLIMGCTACCCCGDKDKFPTERGAVGNCAGLLLMASVGLVFIFAALIMLLVWLLFLVGAPLEQIACVNIRDTEYTLFKQVLDGGDPASGPYTTLMGEQEGYTLGNMVFADPSVPLTISGLLSDCDDNAPAWQALYIANFFDIDAVLDYKGTIDIDGEIDKISVDLSSLEILDSNTKQQLTDMSTAMGDIDFEGLVDALDNTTVTADFDALISSLESSIDTINGQPSTPASATAVADLNSHVAELKRIQADEVVAVQNDQQNMLDNVIALNSTASTVPTQVNTLILTLETTQNDLQSNGVEIIKNESKIFALRVLRIADQFVSFVNTTIVEELGRCKPVSNFYQSVLVNTLCGSIIDSWNGVWFTLGWCVAFMVLGVILSTKLAKHVRRMQALDDNDDPSKDYGPGAGKVHPI